MSALPAWKRCRPLLAMALLLGACGPAAEVPAPDLPNVVFVVLDACRPDKLGCYGYERPTSPRIDELCRDPDAVVFREHYVQGSWTKSSTASLFTGLYLAQHGVISGPRRMEAEDTDRLYRAEGLDPSLTTMAEAFREAGYATIGIVPTYHLEPAYGFHRGFDTYLGPKEVSPDGERIRVALEQAEAQRKPFFLFLHLTACHHPFPPATRDGDYMRRFGFPYDETGRIAAGVDFTTSAIKHALRERRMTLEDEDVRFLHLVYEAQLKTVDGDLVAPLLDGLAERGLYDDTIILLSADHGEELYDHQDYSHGHELWEEVSHVPLIVKFPRDARPEALGAEFPGYSSHVDLFPSLMDHLGLPVSEALPGAYLFRGRGHPYAFAETVAGWSLVRDGFKYMDGERGPRLFDLEADRGETTNLIEARPDLAAEMQGFARDLLASLAIAPVPARVIELEMEEEAIESLRGLGYIP